MKDTAPHDRARNHSESKFSAIKCRVLVSISKVKVMKIVIFKSNVLFE
jgi:hypothetical protein